MSEKIENFITLNSILLQFWNYQAVRLNKSVFSNIKRILQFNMPGVWRLYVKNVSQMQIIFEFPVQYRNFSVKCHFRINVLKPLYCLEIIDSPHIHIFDISSRQYIQLDLNMSFGFYISYKYMSFKSIRCYLLYYYVLTV